MTDETTHTQITKPNAKVEYYRNASTIDRTDIVMLKVEALTKDEAKELFKKAIALEENARTRDPHKELYRGGTLSSIWQDNKLTDYLEAVPVKANQRGDKND